MSQSTSSNCVVKVFDRDDYEGRVKVRWNNTLTTEFELKGSDKWLSSGTIELPRELVSFEIEGTLSWNHYRDGNQQSSGLITHKFVDFTTAVQALRNTQSWGKRMDAFFNELRNIEHTHPDRESTPTEDFKKNDPVSDKEIEVAENRVRTKLPEEHKQLLNEFGAWTYLDSFCVPAENIDVTTTQMQLIWGSPPSEFLSLSEKSKALYRDSTMLFVEGGDGYGALLYHPSAAGDEYYWIHQDNLDQPTKLVDREGNLRDYSSVMRWLIANQILFYYEDALPEHTFIDRSGSTPLPFQLRVDFPTRKQLEARLEVDWVNFD